MTAFLPICRSVTLWSSTYQPTLVQFDQNGKRSLPGGTGDAIFYYSDYRWCKRPSLTLGIGCYSWFIWWCMTRLWERESLANLLLSNPVAHQPAFLPSSIHWPPTLSDSAKVSQTRDYCQFMKVNESIDSKRRTKTLASLRFEREHLATSTSSCPSILWR